MVAASLVSSALLATLTAALVAANAIPFGHHVKLHIDPDIIKRSVTANGNDLNGQTYDYIVVGGGLAGLTVAGRLSEDPNVTVAVIEAGASGQQDNGKFVVPAANLYNSAAGTQYDWQWQTTAQSGLNGRVTPWIRGKVLGGSAAVNGLYYIRHSKLEQDAWARINGQDADGTWGWSNMLRAMKKSETFTPPDQRVLDTLDVPYDASSHGTDGPLHVSWPARIYPPVASFLESVANLGTPINPDPNAGRSWGAFLATSTINPSNWTRSFSRTAYLDPYVYRSNFHVLTGHTVTKVLFSNDTSSSSRSDGGNLVASGVQYSASSGSDLLTVNAGREVILCGGAVNDPQILQLSGIGDAALLQRNNVPVLIDLPGVGYHVQDHIAANLVWQATNPSADVAPQSITGNAVTDSYVNSAIAYINSTSLFGDYGATLQTTMRDGRDAAVSSYDAPEAVKRGYSLTYDVQVDDVFGSSVGPIELLFAISFGGLQVQTALQHPLSRGSILIQSNDPFAAPLIDPGYLRNALDLEMLRTGAKLARQVATTPPLSTHMGNIQAPDASVVSNADLDAWLKNNSHTEYHPSCSCAMLPREAGGVVGTDLKVYGTRNLRVIDAAVPPFSLSAHLMAATYGLAEIGAELVLQERADALSNASSSSSSPSSPTSRPETSGQRNADASAAVATSSLGRGSAMGVATASFAAAILALAL